jgi:fused signal recognition particle receptor
LADVGLATTHQLLGVAREAAASPDVEPAVVREALRQEMSRILTIGRPGIDTSSASPFVILMVGVNGSGKTTTIGKLSRRFSNEGRKVLVAAADTYRAAAADQLAVWAERADADIVRHDEGADPGAVAYDAMAKALAKGHDVVLVDTAGRLQTRKPLMDQLSKIRRVIDKQVPGAPHETLLVVDGTSGQNALSQARAFHEATPLTGVVVTKLDGTAKGGIVLAISAELGIPVRLIGIGEGVEDLRDFEPAAFVEALA